MRVGPQGGDFATLSEPGNCQEPLIDERMVRADRSRSEGWPSEGPGWIAFARESDTVYHTYVVMALDPFVAPCHSFLFERTPEGPSLARIWRKDEYPD